MILAVCPGFAEALEAEVLCRDSSPGGHLGCGMPEEGCLKHVCEYVGLTRSCCRGFGCACKRGILGSDTCADAAEDGSDVAACMYAKDGDTECDEEQDGITDADEAPWR